jgi:hypothetical protein
MGGAATQGRRRFALSGLADVLCEVPGAAVLLSIALPVTLMA